MERNKNKFAKGMMTGAIIGATTALVVNPMINKTKKKKGRIQPKILKNVGNTMSSVVDTFMSNKKY